MTRVVAAFVLTLLSLPAMAQDAQHGAVLFAARCALCHLPDKAKIGPPLAGVVGRKAGSVAGYSYSAELKQSGLTWDQANLDRWLANPNTLVPGNQMVIAVPDPKSRADIIAYLTTLSGGVKP